MLEAEARGREEGLEKGLEKGREEGVRATTLNIARSMLPLVSDDTVIAAATGLSLPEVQALRATG